MKKSIILTGLVFMSLSFNSCDPKCVFSLADLVFHSITSNKEANNGEIVINLNETIEITSEVLNEFADGDCKESTEPAGRSKLKAILNILNEAGDVLGSLDTLYGVGELDAGQLEDVLSRITFFSEGYYELEYELDALDEVEERIETNNWVDVFYKLWNLFEIFFGNNKKSEHTTFKYIENTNRFAIKVGSGVINEMQLKDAISKNDFSSFAKFE